jgi:hypothetical protein
MVRNLARSSVLICGALLALPAAVLAAQQASSEFEVRAGVGNSDNVGRTFVDNESDTIATAGARFSLSKETRLLQANIDGDLSYVDYLKGTFDSELIGSAAADLRVDLIDERLTWVVIDRFGQTRSDLTEAASPSNRENTNQFSTGPDLLLRFGGGYELLLGARYVDVAFQESPFDSERWVQTADFRKQIGGGRTLSLRGGAQQIHLRQAPDYQVAEAVLAFDAAGSRTDMGVEVGGAQVSGKMMETERDPVVRLYLTRRIGSRSALTFRAARETADVGGGFSGWSEEDILRGAASTINVAQTTDPFTMDSVRIGWRTEGRLTTLEASGSWLMEDNGNGFKRRERSAFLHGSRQIGQRMDAGLSLRHVDQNIVGIGDDDEDSAAIDLGWRVGRRLAIYSTAEWSWFHTSFSARTAREFRYWLGLSYGSEVR